MKVIKFPVGIFASAVFLCVNAMTNGADAKNKIPNEIVLEHIVNLSWIAINEATTDEYELGFQKDGTLSVLSRSLRHDFNTNPQYLLPVFGSWKLDDQGTLCTKFYTHDRALISQCGHLEYYNKSPGLTLINSKGSKWIFLHSASKSSIFEQPGLYVKKSGAKDVQTAGQKEKPERQRIAEQARLAAVEKKRLAAIAQAEEEQRVYEELSRAARQYITTVQRYLVDNPTTPLLLEIITASSSINTSLKNESVTGVRAGLETLKATLSRTKGYSNYVAGLEEKRRAKLAAEERIRLEKLAAEVRKKREGLGSYIAFVKRQIIRNLNINPGLTFALMPLAKELQDGMDSKDPFLLASLRNRAAAALEKHALTEQYAEVERAMEETVADARVRDRAAPAQTRVDISKKINRDVSFDDIRFGNYYALVIGNNNYSHMGKLKTAINDATEVAQVLRRAYGFKVNLLTDATRAEMILALSKLRATLKFDDNLLIYYAGHGILDEIGEQGYWLPVDAEQGNPTNWISVGNITVMLRAIRAKHALVIADSCYSGTLVRSGAAQPRTAKEKYAWIKRISGKRSRVALVSGGLEPVTDGGGGGKHSVFANALINALKRNTGVIEGQELFDQIKRPVVLNADQTPSYSDIRKTGHDGGDFILVRRATP